MKSGRRQRYHASLFQERWGDLKMREELKDGIPGDVGAAASGVDAGAEEKGENGPKREEERGKKSVSILMA